MAHSITLCALKCTIYVLLLSKLEKTNIAFKKVYNIYDIFLASISEQESPNDIPTILDFKGSDYFLIWIIP